MAQAQEQEAKEYRGVILPPQMTRECLDELATLFVDYADELLKKPSGGDASASDAAVMAFEVASRWLAGTTDRPTGSAGRWPS
jgi:hypothetical protein